MMKVALVVVALVTIYLVQHHESQRVADRDNRCALQAAATYVPLKADASCIAWQRKSGGQIPIGG